jgi:hypothetical protein
MVLEQSAQLRTENPRIELVVLSVAHILASGLKSDVLPPYAVAVTAVVARFEVGRDAGVQVAQRSKFAAKPHFLTVDFGKPPALTIIRPQYMSRIVESAVEGRVSTHVQALIQGHISQLVKDRVHVSG